MKRGARIVIATGNRCKLAEIRSMLADVDVEILPQSEFGIAGADETGETFLDNALLKARHAAANTGLPSIADDSGLAVDALNGRPGVHSARFAGDDSTDQANVSKLLQELAGVEDNDRGAAFHCAAVLVFPDESREAVIAGGEWRGEILREPRGENGFGYDPVFYDAALGKAAAEMSATEKNNCSHRGRAFATLAELIRSEVARPR